MAPLLAVRSVRDLGPALFIDAARFAERRAADGRSASRIRYEAFCSFVLPQLDGCEGFEAKQIFDAIADAFEAEELHALRRVVAGVTADRVPPPAVSAA